MPEENCYEFTVKDKVQDVGLRLAIARQIPDELEVRTDNLPDGLVRVVVKGKEEEVKRFWKELQKNILGKAENPTFSGPREMTLVPISTDRFFHKLQCEQMEKFVDVGLDMHNDIKGMREDIGGMHTGIKGMHTGIKGMHSDIKGMRSDIKDMHQDMKDLPKNMAKEIVELKKKKLL